MQCQAADCLVPDLSVEEGNEITLGTFTAFPVQGGGVKSEAGGQARSYSMGRQVDFSGSPDKFWL